MLFSSRTKQFLLNLVKYKKLRIEVNDLVKLTVFTLLILAIVRIW